MNKTSRTVQISRAFENGKALIAFVTAGDPSLDKTEEFMVEMEKAGADLIEIGIPFSDPIAEGYIIQEADIRSLGAGTTTDKIFDMVERARDKVGVPIVFRTYLNPVFHYGYERFCERCQAAGVAGVIIPDMPYEEKGELEGICAQYGMELVSMLAPAPKQRIEMIVNEAKGFIYAIPAIPAISAVAALDGAYADGAGAAAAEEACEDAYIVGDIAGMVGISHESTDIPVAANCGISTPEQAKEAVKYADGVIVDTAVVSMIAEKGADAGQAVYELIKLIKDAIR